MRKHNRIRLIFVPFGIFLWIFGWCLSSLSQYKNSTNHSKNKRYPTSLIGTVVSINQIRLIDSYAPKSKS